MIQVEFIPLFCTESEVFEESEVEEDDMETNETKEDFLSGTLGFTFTFPFPGDMVFKIAGTGVRAVGVLDWLEYPLDGDVTLWDFSGEAVFGLAGILGTSGADALDP